MTKINIKKLPKSMVEIEGAIEAEAFESHFKKALSRMGEHVEIDGFRKGKAPEKVLLDKIPEIKILEEMAEMALAEHYPKILEEHKIDAISRPEISITKLARNNPLEFKIKTSVLPEIKLPDYKKIAKTENEKPKEDIIVEDKDEEQAIEDLRKYRAQGKEELPEFNEEFVKSLGNFKDVEDFKAKLRENIKLEKQNKAIEKKRIKIIEDIIEKTEMELPDVLIDLELDKIMYKMESDITGMGMVFEDYLKHINKTRDDIRKELRGDGEKRGKLELILNEIAKIENLSPDAETIEKEVAHILEHYKDADPMRARIHAENVLTNEKVFQFLESI